MNEKMTIEAEAVRAMQAAWELLSRSEPSRANSLAITNLEQAMMWCNKDRTMKGELQPYPTHVEAEEGR